MHKQKKNKTKNTHRKQQKKRAIFGYKNFINYQEKPDYVFIILPRCKIVNLKQDSRKSKPHKNTFNKKEVTKINIYPWLYKGMKRQHVSQHSSECSGKNYYCFMGMQCGCGMDGTRYILESDLMLNVHEGQHFTENDGKNRTSPSQRATAKYTKCFL